MGVVLRSYQTDLIHRARANFKAGRKRVLIQSPTGSGKTALCAHMIRTAKERGYKAWFLVHRRELINQAMRAFDLEGISYAICAAGFQGNVRETVQIASIMTLVRRLDRLPPPDLVVIDECHHLAAKSWSDVYEKIVGAYVIGLSATPQRLDGRGLDKYFDVLECGPSVAALVEKGYLAPYRLFAPTTIDTAGVHTLAGDFKISELAAVVDKPVITGDAIAHYKKHAAGKRAIVFACSIEHSQHLAAQFSAAGVPAYHIDGCSDASVRDMAVRDFTAGRIMALCSVDLLCEGLDIPAIECAILLRPTQSLTIYLQQVGRAMRPFEGKERTVILDHAGNSQRHGLPDDPRTWSLAGRPDARLSAPMPSPRICPSCFGASRAGAVVCRICGRAYPVEAREVEQRDGELAEVTRTLTPEQRTVRREQGLAKDRQALVALAMRRGYKAPDRWAEYVLQGRAKKAAQA